MIADQTEKELGPIFIGIGDDEGLHGELYVAVDMLGRDIENGLLAKVLVVRSKDYHDVIDLQKTLLPIFSAHQYSRSYVKASSVVTWCCRNLLYEVGCQGRWKALKNLLEERILQYAATQ